MAKEIIVDTSALIAFFVKSETNHLKAKDYVLNHQDNGWIILETVFDETLRVRQLLYLGRPQDRTDSP